MTEIGQIFVKFSKTVTINGLKTSDTVRDLKAKIQDKEGYLIEEQRLIYGGKPLEDKETLAYCNIIKKSTIHVALRLLDSQPSKYEQRCKKRGIQVTTKICQLNFTGDCSGEKTIKMKTCRDECYVCVDCLEMHYENNKNNGSDVYCPVNKNKCPNFKLDDIFAALDYSPEKIKDEYTHWDKIYLETNCEISKCPKCGQYSFRDKNLKTWRVKCPAKTCKGGDYCFYCMGEWKTSSDEYCGNNDCKSSPQTLAKLLNCTTKNMNGVKDIPSIRLCPICKVIIEHGSGGKHMSCKICKHKFCFICLRKWCICTCKRCTKGRNNGCSLRIKCTPAPRQKLINLWN